MDIERLKTDPAYWDEVAPEGAEVYIIDHDEACVRMPAEFHYSDTERGSPVWRECDGRMFWLKDCADPLEIIPRPSQPQWRGPEDGLPPVGTVCEASRHGGWAECEIIAHVRAPENRIEAVYQADDDWDWLSSPTNFRPLKSDKERAIDAAVAATILEDGPRIRAALSDIYDAGLLKLPEDTQ